MRFIIDVPVDTAKKIRKLILDGRYSGFNEFVLVALHNQVGLEEIDESLLEADPQILGASGLTEIHVNQRSLQHLQPVAAAILHLEGYSDVATASMPPAGMLPKGPLWGQYNRIFPVKLVLRILANILKGKGPYISLEKFQETAADAARQIGLRLRDVDMERSRSRGEKLSTALPIGENAFKSKSRFKSQFIGYIDGSGRPVGSPSALRLISLIDDGNSKIGITEPGLSFATLRNPILDEDGNSERSLAEAEAEFYLQHVSTQVLGEANAMMVILRNIESGHNRPNDLTERISDLNDRWTKDHASTIRSGLVGRMCELGLISRRRIGVRGFAYELTPRGRSLLQEQKDG